jgi:hypothetical protein
MSLKNSLSAIGTFIAIVALMMASPGVSDASGAAHRSISREQSPVIVVAENEPASASISADSADSETDADSKDSDDETAQDDQNDDTDQTEQQSAGNAQVNPQFQNGDNDAGEAGQAPMNANPQQVNPYQANPYQ